MLASDVPFVRLNRHDVRPVLLVGGQLVVLGMSADNRPLVVTEAVEGLPRDADGSRPVGLAVWNRATTGRV